MCHMTGTVSTHDDSDLRQLAAARVAPVARVDRSMSAGAAVQALSGVAGVMARQFGLPFMQEACAALVRSKDVWASSFGRLPLNQNGSVHEAVATIAAAARALLPLAGSENLRAALAFWATERDPSVWLSIVA
jgi:hypothetical protein